MVRLSRLIVAALVSSALLLVGGTASAAASCAVPNTGYTGAITSTAGLVSYWRLGELNSGTACDSGPGANDGTYYGNSALGKPGAIAGDSNTSVLFDGTNSHVRVPDSSSLDLGDTFTAEAWVKRTRTGGQNYSIVSKQAGSWMVMIDDTNHVVLRQSTVGDVAESTTTIPDTSNWHFVAATKNGSSVHIYIDGVDVTGSVTNRTMQNNTNVFEIGESSSTAWFAGYVDEVAVYRSALTASQVKAHYDAGTGSTSAPPPPPPPPPSSTDPVIATAGDIACDPQDPNFNRGSGTASYCRQKATSNLLINTGLAGVVTLGDEQYDDGALTKFQAVYDTTWGRVNNIGRQALGNHEYLTAGAKGYFDYFAGVGVNSSPATGTRGKGWYSYDIGTWHFIALNSNCTEVDCTYGSPQETWLRQDLAAHPNQCVAAYFHHPRFSSGIAGNYTPTSQFWNDLYNANADLVLSAHDHDYERFAPQTPGKTRDDARGIREFVVGTGGKSLKGFDATVANSEVRHTGTYGVLRLTLHPGSYDWKFVPEAGQTWTDSGSTNCH